MTAGFAFARTGMVASSDLARTGMEASSDPARTGMEAPSDPARTGRESAWLPQAIRLHIVANSDSEADQARKRAVRDAILAEISPLFAASVTADEAEAAIAATLPRIEAIAAAVLSSDGQDYPVHAEVGTFAFPGKAYGAIFLPAGEYRALRVLIGEGKGANWWCILFPPMCFVDWSVGVVLEPRPETGGTETITVSRPPGPAQLLDEQQLTHAPVKARLAILEWVRALRTRERESDTPQ